MIEFIKSVEHLICKSVNASHINFTNKIPDNYISIIIIGDLKIYIKSEEGRSYYNNESLEKDLDYYTSLLQIVDKKLSNKKFIENAPISIIDLEKKKKLDTENKINLIKSSL